MKDLRSVVVKVVVGSFSLAALLGILALLGGGSFSETQGRVLLTTVIVGVESVAVLCYLSVGGTRRAAVGLAGGVVSLVPFAIALWFTWVSDGDGSFLWRTFGVGLTIAASLAQVSLLLSVARGSRRRAGGLLVATLVSVAVLAAMIVVPIVAEPDLGDWYWRLLGIVAILDVLGTVVVIVLEKFVAPSPRPGTTEPGVLSPAVESRLVDAARARGTSPDVLLAELLDGVAP